MKFIKKYRNYILAFLIPFTIYFLFFLWKGIFTDKSILSSDMVAQYLPISQYFKDVLYGTATFPYTFSKGIGGGMYGALFYDFANPINLLVYFFENIPFFFTCLILFKLSLSGLTMYIFLKHKFKDEKYLLIFSLAYALMGYNINYYVNFMWLDGVFMAPIVLLGIDRMIEKKKSGLYIISLFLSIFFNYYIGYMIVIFSCIYFMYEFLLKNKAITKEKLKEIIHFFIVTFLVGLMTSFILIPVGLELLNIARVPLNSNNRWINFNFLDFIAPTYIGLGNLIHPLNYQVFLIFCGTIMMPLIICYFFNKKINKREKILTIIVYLFLLLPIFLTQLNRLWHMSTLPMGFNYRYSFLGTLFTIVIMIRSLKKMELAKKPLLLYFLLYIIFSVSLGYTSTKVPDYYIYMTIPKIIVTIILLGINIFLLLKKKIKLIMIVLVLELVTNLVWIGAESEMVLASDYIDAKKKITEFSEFCTENRRCETTFGFTKNDSLFVNYTGVSVFLTSQNGKVLNFLNKLGGESVIANSYKYYIDYALDTLLGVEIVETRYPVYDYEVIKEYSYQNVDLYLLKNKNSLSLGYVVSSNIKSFKIENGGIQILEDIFNVMSGEQKEYFYTLSLDKIDSKNYRLVKDQEYPSLYISHSNKFTINGKEIDNFIFRLKDYIIIYDEYGDTLDFSFEEEEENFKTFVLDASKVKEFKESRTELIVDKNTGNKIEGHIESKENAVLFTTIPYEKGWKVFVDGKEVTTYEVLDTFLAIDIEEGYHTIIFEYHVYGLKLGIFISVTSFLLLLGYEYKYKKSITRLE